MNVRRFGRAAGAVAATSALYAGAIAAGHGMPAAQAAVRATRAPVVQLRYNPSGVQLTCRKAELGWFGIVSGDGAPFTVRCVRDGQSRGARAYVWDVV